MSDEQNQEEEFTSNDNLVLIGGESSGGKSASLRNIRNQEKWLYLNTESGKKLPFKNKFRSFTIIDPLQVIEAFDAVISGQVEAEGIVLDSLTFLMDQYESQYVIPATNTMAAWGNYQQFFKTIMQEKVAAVGIPVIIIAHVLPVYDEKAMDYKTGVPIKGALKNNGVEAYFSTVVHAVKVEIKELEKYGSDLLTITDEDRELGYKHVFQTRPTGKTVGSRIRSPMGMFSRSQSYMDNDAQLLIDHLQSYYAD